MKPAHATILNLQWLHYMALDLVLKCQQHYQLILQGEGIPQLRYYSKKLFSISPHYEMFLVFGHRKGPLWLGRFK